MSSNEMPILVGHRGYPQVFPENSLLGIQAALELGAQAIEIDIQASLDGEPIVCHDLKLSRVAGLAKTVDSLSAAQLQQLSAHEPRRFREQFNPCPLPHLNEVVALLKRYPDALLFVELKEDIFKRFSRRNFVTMILPLLAPLRQRVFIISFDLPCLRITQELAEVPVGWVLRHYNTRSLQQLHQQPVDVVICDHHKLPISPEPLWQGPWRWFIYDIVDADQIMHWWQRGISYIETWDIGAMMSQDPNRVNARRD